MASTDTEQNERAEFAARGYVRIAGLIAPELTDFLWKYVCLKAVSGLMKHGDKGVPGAMVRYGDEAFEALLESVRPRIEAATGLSLLPTFSYVRLYARGNDLARHRDRGACEISASLNLGQIPDAPWPLHLRGPDGETSVALNPGEAVIYRGIKIGHWREPYEGSQLAQVFLHYVDRAGPYADRRFDGRGGLMRPRAVVPPDGDQHRDE